MTHFIAQKCKKKIFVPR